MANHLDRKQKLSDLFEEGLLIYKTNGLYGIVDHIPKSDEPNFNQNFSMAQFIKQGWKFDNYGPWYDKLIQFFDTFNLSFALFEKKLFDVDRRTHSIYPAAVFKRTLDELEKLMLDPNYFSAYQKTSRRPTLYGPVEYSDGTISQGYKSHKYQDGLAIRIIEYLWEVREFLAPDDSVAKEGKLVTFEESMKDLEINSLDKIRSAADAINKSARYKKIGLRLKLPKKKNGIKLVVIQEIQ